MRLWLFIVALVGAGQVEAYFEYTLEHPSVCDPLAKKRTIKLENKDRSALHLTSGRKFRSWTGSAHFDCTFEVKTISKDQLAVVIQKIKLRQDPITNECIDYVQFKRDNKPVSHKYCGELSALKSTMITTDSEEIIETAYLHFEDDLVINIHIEKKPLEPGEKLDVDLMFTSFKLCSENVAGYTPCGLTKMCIWDGFFHDGRLNCPYYGCLDESFCWDENKKPTYHINSELNILFVFVTALILIVLVVWMYLKCRASFLDDGIPRELRCTEAPATAPPLDDPKDAPPPYESLFPNGPEAAPLVSQPAAVVVDETARTSAS